jgi:hypothetical protein
VTITITLPPDTEQRLLARAAASGKDVHTWVREVIEEKLQTPKPTFAEVLAPVHADFRNSGMTAAQLDTLLEETIAEVRDERR